MTYRIAHVRRDSYEYRDVLRSLVSVRRMGLGRWYAVQACLGAESSCLAVAWFSSGRVAGASSYRVFEGQIKRINTGAVVRGRGVGRALVRFIAEQNPGLPMWSKNTKEGGKFARALGMRYVGREGRHTKHEWSAAEVKQWLAA